MFLFTICAYYIFKKKHFFKFYLESSSLRENVLFLYP